MMKVKLDSMNSLMVNVKINFSDNFTKSIQIFILFLNIKYQDNLQHI